jgi:parvulin-like peptidyl-prolyl isomerase
MLIHIITALFRKIMDQQRYKKNPTNNRTHYSKHRSIPDKIHCAYILSKTESEARTVIECLNKEENFANIARQVSHCPSAKRGGDLGNFGRGVIVKEFETSTLLPGKEKTCSNKD